MTQQARNKERALEMVEKIFNQRNLDAITDYYHPDVVDHSLPKSMPQGLKGKQMQVAAFITAFPDLRITYNFQVAENDLVAGYYTMTGTHLASMGEIPVTGKKIKISGFDCLRFKDGMVIEHRNVIDDLDFMKQLGVIPVDYLIGE